MRYAELSPEELRAVLDKKPVAIWPIGALEWHGPHLPLGLDGIVAEGFAARLQELVGGVLLPTLWHPITTLPHPMSLDVATDTFRSLVRRTSNGLFEAGVRVLCIVTGHYAQGHSIELFQLAQDSNRRQEGIAMIAASPLEPLENESLLDHAGRWEAAQLKALRPELVHGERLADPITPKTNAVLGEDPRMGDPKEAIEAWDRALTVWESWVDQALAGNLADLSEFYVRRFNRYAPYTTKYFRESWDQAIQDWWTDQS